MRKEFCDLCEKEVTDNTLSATHWCGNFRIGDIRAEVELKFFNHNKGIPAKVCRPCRWILEGKILELELDHWVATYRP